VLLRIKTLQQTMLGLSMKMVSYGIIIYSISLNPRRFARVFSSGAMTTR